MPALNVFSVSGGASQLLFESTGSGFARITEGDGIFIYAAGNQLLASRDGGSTFTNIAPSGYGYVPAFCQSANGIGDGPGKFYGAISVAFATIGQGSSVPLYSQTPEGTSSWTVAGSLASNFRASDAIGDETGYMGILVGNGNSASGVKVERSVAGPPFSFVESDTGLPQSGAQSALVDLESAT